MTLLESLRAEYELPNVQAWGRVLREGESNQNEDAFRIRFGGAGKPAAYFDSFDDHPRIFEPTEDGRKSSAAGAWQITATTWGDFCRAVGETLPFTPENQALCMVWLTARAKALDDVIAGRLDAAIRKCSAVWTSLALAHRRAQAPEIFAAYGGTLETSAAPIIETATEATPEVKPMVPILIPILAELAKGLIPQLGQLFGSGSEVQTRNVAAATVLADTIVKATDAVNLQEAADKIANDPAAMQAARAAVADVWPSVVEAGSGGLDGARKAAANPDQVPLLKDKTVWVTATFMPLIYMVVIAALVKVDWIAEVTSETRAFVIGFVLGSIGASILAYFYGTTVGSQKKDALIAAKS